MLYLKKHKQSFSDLKKKVESVSNKIDNIKHSSPVKSGFKTILDYGATMYKSNYHALDGQNSSSQAIEDMKEDKGTAVTPPYGSFYMDKGVRLYRERESIVSLGQGNRGVNLVTDKPINMFMPTHSGHEIKGFTAYYVGKDITEECAVVKVGGKHKGAIDIKKDWVSEYHHWKDRTRVIRNVYDFDFEGDKRYYLSRKLNSPYPYNDEFVKGNAHGVWVDMVGVWSHCHHTKIRGNWTLINTGIKIKENHKNQSINTFDANVKIWGAKQFCNIDGAGLFKIKIDGQHQDTLDWNKDYPHYLYASKVNKDGFHIDESFEEWSHAYVIKNCNQVISDVFNFDRGRHWNGNKMVRHSGRNGYAGLYENVKNLKFTGYQELTYKDYKLKNCTVL